MYIAEIKLKLIYQMIHWLSGCLKERKQYAEVNGKFSSVEGLEFGVPRESLLGSHIFSILVNDPLDALSVGQLFCMLMIQLSFVSLKPW